MFFFDCFELSNSTSLIKDVCKKYTICYDIWHSDCRKEYLLLSEMIDLNDLSDRGFFATF